MFIKSVFLIAFTFSHIVFSDVLPPDDTLRHDSHRPLKITSGIILLGAECIGFPLLDVKFNYGKLPRLRNPFRYIKEKEPFLQDELWHFVGASAFTELNYYLFRIALSGKPISDQWSFSIAFWTGMECLMHYREAGFLSG